MSYLYPQFEDLHRHTGSLWVLPNVWDAAGAALAQRAGARAVGTSSAAMAWSCGFADGGALPEVALLQRVSEIVRVLSIPLTVDIEDGYSDNPAQAAQLAVKLAALGVAGINIEDGAKSPRLLADKIAAIRGALGARPLFINARTDVYLRAMAQGEEAARMSIERLNIYADAGANGGFVPGLVAPGEIARIAAGQPMPLNVMWLPGIGSHQGLAAAGVRRLSAGPALFTIAAKAMADSVEAFMEDAISLPSAALGYAEMNELFPPGG